MSVPDNIPHLQTSDGKSETFVTLVSSRCCQLCCQLCEDLQEKANVNECVGDVDTDGTLWVTVLRRKRCPPGRDTGVGLGMGGGVGVQLTCPLPGCS